MPLKTLVEKFAHTRFEPSGFTKNPDIPIAKSITDYIFRWLGHDVPGGLQRAGRSSAPGPARSREPAQTPAAAADAGRCRRTA